MKSIFIYLTIISLLTVSCNERVIDEVDLQGDYYTVGEEPILVGGRTQVVKTYGFIEIKGNSLIDLPGVYKDINKNESIRLADDSPRKHVIEFKKNIIELDPGMKLCYYEDVGLFSTKIITDCKYKIIKNGNKIYLKNLASGEVLYKIIK